MSGLWLLPLGVGAGGALVILAAVKRLDANVARLRESMRPLRTRTGRTPDGRGTV